MKEGWYNRSFEATLQVLDSGQYSTFLSIVLDEVGIINYEILP
jgi:maltose phosphorylase